MKQSPWPVHPSPLLPDRVDESIRLIHRANTVPRRGKITQASAHLLKVTGLTLGIGQLCRVRDASVGLELDAEVIGISAQHALLQPLAPIRGLSLHAEVEALARQQQVLCGDSLRGRVLGASGQPLDHRPLPEDLQPTLSQATAPNPLDRGRIRQLFRTGIAAIDGLFSVGVGQRLGIFAPAGAGKSGLLGMLARHAEADVNVIALIGERGREVNDFLEEVLGPAGLLRSVVVVSTSDRSPMEKIRAAQTASALAEFFRAQGGKVLLLMDSLTRYARALRDIGLAMGEPPLRQGFPPSVFVELPRLLERAGPAASGSITAFYSVLSEQDDDADPIAEEVRSLLDGHITLSRELAASGQYPAIDLSACLSRLSHVVTSPAHHRTARHLRRLATQHAELQTLLQIGDYQAGSDALSDEAIAKVPELMRLLRQELADSAELLPTLDALSALAVRGHPASDSKQLA